MRYTARRYVEPRIAEQRLQARILSDLFPAQRAFAVDQSPLLVAQCGRRAGKTRSAAAKLVLGALSRPGTLSAYITLTRRNAKRLMLPELQAMSQRYGLGATFNHQDLTVTFPNGSTVWLGGADNEREIEKYRGFGYLQNILDECASFGSHLTALIEDVLEPALLEHKGSMSMIGNPGHILAGKFHDACVEPNSGWVRHRWTVLDNPFIPHAAAYLRDKETQMSPASYQREWMGEWVADAECQVYAYAAARNLWTTSVLPPSPAPWEYGLGVDLGYSPDPAAFVVVAWNRRDPHIFVLESERVLNLTPSEMADRIQSYRQRYHFNVIVADGAGLGKGIIAEWRQRFGIPVNPARDKHLKRDHIGLMNSDFRAGHIQIKEGLPLCHELLHVVWDRDRKHVSDAFPNDLCDAFEYIWTAAKHFAFKPYTVPAPTGSAEALQREADAYEEKLSQASRRARRSALL